jgi:hypothetical protein
MVSVDEPFGREPPLDMAVNHYRIAQDATTNALRHSGASHIDISLYFDTALSAGPAALPRLTRILGLIRLPSGSAV